MELNEVTSRIFRTHWLVILMFVLLGMTLAALLHLRDTYTYTASARIVLDTQDPKSRAESEAIADTAQAIATSPSQVRGALEKVGAIGRDPVELAEHDVSVRALGSSGVLELSVRDRSRRGARAITNALAASVIQARLGLTQGEVQRVLARLDEQIGTLSRRISAADARIDALNVNAATASDPASANVLRARRNDQARLRDFLAQQRGVLESQRVNLVSTEAFRPKPSIISRADLPREADPSRRLADLTLGALLGLVLGVGFAGILEALRPTLVGADALARELRAPVLGTLPAAPDDEGALEHTGDIAARLKLAVESAALRKVSLLPVEGGTDVGPLAERLHAAVIESASHNVNGTADPASVPVPGLEPLWSATSSEQRDETESAGHSRSRPLVRPFSLDDPSLNNGGAAGLVLVLPMTVKKAELVRAGHLLSLIQLPLVGLITYAPRHGRARRRRAADLAALGKA